MVLFTQFHHLLPEFSALENVMLPLIMRGDTQNDAKQKAIEILNDFGMIERADHYPSALSGGEQQRVAIARQLFMIHKLF